MQINDFFYVSLIFEISYLSYISHDNSLRPYLMTLCKKNYVNLARTCRDKFYENKINLNWIRLLKTFWYSITDRTGMTKSPPLLDDDKATGNLFFGWHWAKNVQNCPIFTIKVTKMTKRCPTTFWLALRSRSRRTPQTLRTLHLSTFTYDVYIYILR